MARAATTADTFNAVAEPRRRAILDVLARGERSVNDLVAELGMAQPQVSKHLRVLREVGAVAIDLRELDFIDSSGVHELLRCRDAALDSGARLHLLVAPRPVSRALELCGVRSRFDERPPAAIRP